ncbi:hypothetical protein N9L01_00770 [bacterium]|nr:hypothetical protein [bacterium]
MPGLAATRHYVFGEEYEFMQEPAYRENMIPLIVKAEDDALAYFNRVCQEIGWREEKYEEYESWFEGITGNPPDKTQELDMLRLVGEVEPTESEIIRLLGLLDDYDVAEVGAYEILNSVLEETNETFWNIQQPGEYSKIVLQIWTRQDLLEHLGSGKDPLRALINLRRNP